MEENVLIAVTSLAPGGEAVGRQVGGDHDGRVTFLPFAAPGDRVRARIVREKSRLAWAALVAVDSPGPRRVTPPCPLFGRCGGCQWQHVEAEVQRAAKRDIVLRALGRVDELLAVGPPYGYRDRARFTVGRASDGGVAVGFRAWRSHAIVDVPRCPLLGPALAEALDGLRAAAREAPPGTEVHVAAGGGEVAARIGARTIGGGTIDVAEPGSPPLRIPPDAFAQVGAAANAALIATVLEAVGAEPGRLLELHAGSGNFTRHLVARGPVVAWDADAAAVQRGRDQVPRADWRPPAGERYDTVLVDPPRAGLDAGALAQAGAAGRRLVYVSCDPQTLGRDARMLAERGLVLERVVALDLMPQTYHVEVVASFGRL